MKHRWAPWLLGCLWGCSPAAPPSSPSLPGPPGPRQATYSFVYEYGAQLTLGVRRDGVLFQGVAQLRSQASPQLLGDHSLDLSRPDLSGRRADLTFQGGKASIAPDDYEWMGAAQALQLQINDQLVELPQPRSTNPFFCAQNIWALQGIDPCAQLLPPTEPAPDACDPPGQRAWLAEHKRQQERFEQCFPALDEATLRRFQAAQSLAPAACPRLLAMAGPGLGDELGLGLAPACLPYMEPDVRARIERAQLLRDLPGALASARAGTSAQMLDFFRKYRPVAPEKAEEIRKLAASQFGPPDPKKWLTLRDALEAASGKQGSYHFTLCDIQPTTVHVGFDFNAPPRASQAPRFDDSPGRPAEPPTFQRVYSIGVSSKPRFTPLPLQTRLITQIVARHEGKKQVQFSARCTQGNHWYFAHEPGHLAGALA